MTDRRVDPPGPGRALPCLVVGLIAGIVLTILALIVAVAFAPG